MGKRELNEKLKTIDASFGCTIKKTPPREQNEPSPYWLHFELVERFKIVSRIGIQQGMNILKIGCGPHAITTIVLAHLIKPNGRVVVIERTRWLFVEELLTLTGLIQQVVPISLDAINLPIPYKFFDISVIIHMVLEVWERIRIYVQY